MSDALKKAQAHNAQGGGASGGDYQAAKGDIESGCNASDKPVQPCKSTKAERRANRKSQIKSSQDKLAGTPPGKERDELNQATTRFAENINSVEKAQLASNVYTPEAGPPEGWKNISDDKDALAKYGLKPSDLETRGSEFRAQMYEPDDRVFGTDMKPVGGVQGHHAHEWRGLEQQRAARPQHGVALLPESRQDRQPAWMRWARMWRSQGTRSAAAWRRPHLVRAVCRRRRQRGRPEPRHGGTLWRHSAGVEHHGLPGGRRGLDRLAGAGASKALWRRPAPAFWPAGRWVPSWAGWPRSDFRPGWMMPWVIGGRCPALAAIRWRATAWIKSFLASNRRRARIRPNSPRPPASRR